jgi:hypothetical protein
MGECVSEGMFLFAGETDRRTDVFVLSSSEFEVDSECRLDFFVHMAGSQGRLRVCLNDALNECLYQRSGNQLTTDSRKWNNAFVPLKPGKYTVSENRDCIPERLFSDTITIFAVIVFLQPEDPSKQLKRTKPGRLKGRNTVVEEIP